MNGIRKLYSCHDNNCHHGQVNICFPQSVGKKESNFI